MEEELNKLNSEYDKSEIESRNLDLEISSFYLLKRMSSLAASRSYHIASMRGAHEFFHGPWCDAPVHGVEIAGMDRSMAGKRRGGTDPLRRRTLFPADTTRSRRR